MILQALVKHYEDLVACGKADMPGWAPVKVSFALDIDDEGTLKRIVPLKEEILIETKGKTQKSKWVPREMFVPAPVKRSSGIKANFMCDNSTYVLGIDNKGKPDRAIKCFEAMADFHRKMLADCMTPESAAILSFFEKWNPEHAEEIPEIKKRVEELTEGGNFVFVYKGKFVHEYDSIKLIWNESQDSEDRQEKQLCMVTGKYDKLAVLHPSIKGLLGAQSSGASLVSFNCQSFCSYDKEQGQNAPTGEYAAFAYGRALNSLVSDRDNNHYIGDTLVLSWADGGDWRYQKVFGGFTFGDDVVRGDGDEGQYTEYELRLMLDNLCNGKTVNFEGEKLNPDCNFYILGISPNAARISVRFFIKNSFGRILKNVDEHYKRLEIIKPSYDNFELIPLWKLADETVNHNSREKKPSPTMTGELLRAVLNGTRYPASLLNGVNLRIRAEREITRGRAAIIKAYYLKNKNVYVPEEVLTVSLNTETKNPAYVLGRLFAELEDIQKMANGSINTTIKDKYFNSASATPASVFPTLINLAQKHLRSIPEGNRGKKINKEKELGSIMDLLGEDFPKRLSLPEQGAFQLGYYHQVQAHFRPRENKEA